VSAPGIDRIGPTLRPEGLPVMRQAWSELMFLHWPVPSAVLRAPDEAAREQGFRDLVRDLRLVARAMKAR